MDLNFLAEQDLLYASGEEVVTRIFVVLALGAYLWFLKNSLLQKLAPSFYVDVKKSQKCPMVNHNNTVLHQLDVVLKSLVIIHLITWVLMMEAASTRVLIVASLLLVFVGSVCSDMCKITSECIIFVFGNHPFDLGDVCVIDGAQLMVEEMNILTTIFRNSVNEKVLYPNTLLATKTIKNLFRSPSMSDFVRFCVHLETPVEKTDQLKAEIENHLKENLESWNANDLIAREIRDVKCIKTCLLVNHAMNFPDYNEKCRCIGKLVLGVKNILDELDIGYEVLSQDLVEEIQQLEPKSENG